MAQTGYTPLQIYSSSTAAQAPAAGNLTNSTLGSELAINITDGKLFYKDNANAVQVIAWKTTPTTAGGTGLTSYTAGDLLYYASGTTFTKLAIGATGRWLGSSGTAPQWNAPAALTKTDDTNVTLTLGGSASTALLNAASITVGWTGTLAVSRGGTGLSSFTANTIPYASGTTTLTSGTALQFTGKVIGTSITPNWASNYSGLQGQEGYGAFLSDNGNGAFESASNAYNDGSWKYVNSSIGAVRIMGDAVAKSIKLFTAPAGTAGGAITWTQRFTVTDTATTVNADNIVFGTAAKGVNFTANTPAAGMTSQLLNWYEEGTWTPKDNAGANLTQNNTAIYVRIGRLVTLHFDVSWTADTGAFLKNFPFTVGATKGTGICSYQNSASAVVTFAAIASTTYAEIYNGSNGSVNPANVRFIGTITYQV